MKKLFLFSAMLLSSSSVWAYKYPGEKEYYYNYPRTEVNGIYYDFNGDEAIVSCKFFQIFEEFIDDRPNQYRETFESAEYSGVLEIPSTVEYEGKTYTVTGIDNGAFCGCFDLTHVILPSTITHVGDICRSKVDDEGSYIDHDYLPLSVISFNSPEPPTCHETAFSNFDYGFYVEVPTELVDLYKSSSYFTGVDIRDNYKPDYYGAKYILLINDVELEDGATIYIHKSKSLSGYQSYDFNESVELTVQQPGFVYLRDIVVKLSPCNRNYSNCATLTCDDFTATSVERPAVLANLPNQPYDTHHISVSYSSKYYNTSKKYKLTVYPSYDATAVTSLYIEFDSDSDGDQEWPVQRCAVPTISVEGNQLVFGCDTPGATIKYTKSLSYAGNDNSETGVNYLIDGDIIIKAKAEAPGYATSDAVTYTVPVFSGPRGDANADGTIDVGDITTLQKQILEKK